MKKRGILILLALLTLLLVPAGCKKSTISLGEYHQNASGGKEYAEGNINLKDISVSTTGDHQTITLSFIQGDRNAQVEESRIDGVPAYRVTGMEMPYRLKIELSGVDFDAAFEESSWAPQGAVQGIFRTDIIENRPFTLYVQVDSQVDYKIEETSDKLILHVRNKKQKEGTKYFAYISAFNEYKYGELPQEMDALTPTLCEDINRRVMISPPFNSESEANTYAEKINKIAQNNLTGKQAATATLKGGELPGYSTHALELQAEELEVLQKDGKAYKLPIHVPGARFVCATSDHKSKLFVSTHLRQDSAEDEPAVIDELLLLTDGDKVTRLPAINDIYNLQDAAFSPDNKKLAILEDRGDATSLYYCDMETNTLFDLSEQGLGGNVSAFAWSDSDTLFALGDQVYMCKLTASDDEMIKALDELPVFATGNFGYAQGHVYYLKTNDESVAGKSYIERLSLEGEKERFSDGTRFRIAPSGKYIAFCIDSIAKEEGEAYKSELLIRDVLQQEATSIVKGETITSYSFSPSGNKLFYSTLNTTDGNFTHKLYRYNIATGSSEFICDAVSDEVYAISDNELYIVVSIGDAAYYASYYYKLP